MKHLHCRIISFFSVALEPLQITIFLMQILGFRVWTVMNANCYLTHALRYTVVRGWF